METIFILEFKTQTCKVALQFIDSLTLRIVSETDGYHWLQYWLSQEPDAVTLADNDYETSLKIIRELMFGELQARYTQEDKESAFLRFNYPYTDDDIGKLMQIIKDRFANRERFFED